MFKFNKKSTILILFCCLASTDWTVASEADDLVVAVNGQGKLSFEGVPIEPVELPVSQNGLFPGWLFDDPGFASLSLDEPAEDLFVMAVGADIQLEVVSIDNGLRILGPSGFPVLESPGDSLSLGGHAFDTHPLLHISSIILPAYDGAPLIGTFKFVDTGTTGYDMSDAFSLTFVPEPISLALLGLGGMLLHRRNAYRAARSFGKEKAWRALCLIICLAVTVPASLQAQTHTGDIAVGRTSDGKLKVANLPDPRIDLECLEAVPQGHPFFSGWFGNVTGFDRITEAGPDPNFFPLQSGAQVHLHLVVGAQGFQVVNALNLAVIDQPGEELLLGGSILHIHPFWNFNISLATGEMVLPADFAGSLFATFKLTDNGSTGYADSEPFTLAFSNTSHPLADINQDGLVDPSDLTALSQNWLDVSCTHPDWCERADIDHNGVVDLGDFSRIGFQWMASQVCNGS